MNGKLNYKISYLLDLLSFFNPLSGEKYFYEMYETDYHYWMNQLSDESKKGITKATRLIMSKNLGSMLITILSTVHHFDEYNVIDLFSNPKVIKHQFLKSEFYNQNKGVLLTCVLGQIGIIPILNAVRPAIIELEQAGFREYWVEHKLPLLKEKVSLLEKERDYQVIKAIGEMLGDSVNDNRDIDIYLTTYLRDIATGLDGRKLQVGVHFDNTWILRLTMHEMFHPPYNQQKLKKFIKEISQNEFFDEIYKTKNYLYPTKSSFVEENVVEAMEVYKSETIGLCQNPIEFLLEHDNGSHVLSVVLYDTFKKKPKLNHEAFEDYLLDVLNEIDISTLKEEYDRIITSVK